MSVVFILVFVAIAMALAFLIAFIWAVKSGQYEDTYTPSVRILFDDFLSGKGDSGKVKENNNEIKNSLSQHEERK